MSVFEVVPKKHVDFSLRSNIFHLRADETPLIHVKWTQAVPPHLVQSEVRGTAAA